MILASFNKINNNTFRDAVLISIFNSLTSIYAGFVVFSVLGFLAESTQKPIELVVTEGIKLAFVAYPSAVLEMDDPLPAPLWSFLFFFMLMNLALSSSLGGTQNILSFILDEWPQLHKHRVKVRARNRSKKGSRSTIHIQSEKVILIYIPKFQMLFVGSFYF